MGKDKRKQISVIVGSYRLGRNAVVLSQEPNGTDKQLFDLPLPVSAEEIILKLDISNIKWRCIIFDDKRQYRGVINHFRVFNGDTITINKSDTIDPEKYQNLLIKVNRSILRIRDDALDMYTASRIQRAYNTAQIRKKIFGHAHH